MVCYQTLLGCVLELAGKRGLWAARAAGLRGLDTNSSVDKCFFAVTFGLAILLRMKRLVALAVALALWSCGGGEVKPHTHPEPPGVNYQAIDERIRSLIEAAEKRCQERERSLEEQIDMLGAGLTELREAESRKRLGLGQSK